LDRIELKAVPPVSAITGGMVRKEVRRGRNGFCEFKNVIARHNDFVKTFLKLKGDIKNVI